MRINCLFHLIRQVILLTLSVLVLKEVGIFFEARGSICGLLLPAIIVYYGVASLIHRHHLTQQLIVVYLLVTFFIR